MYEISCFIGPRYDGTWLYKSDRSKSWSMEPISHIFSKIATTTLSNMRYLWIFICQADIQFAKSPRSLGDTVTMSHEGCQLVTSRFVGMHLSIILHPTFICYADPWKFKLSQHSHNGGPGSKVHGANMGSIWGRQDTDGPHDGPWTLLSGVLWREPQFYTNCCSAYHFSQNM